MRLEGVAGMGRKIRVPTAGFWISLALILIFGAAMYPAPLWAGEGDSSEKNTEQEVFQTLESQIQKEGGAAQQKKKAHDIAGEIRAIDAERKALTRAAETISSSHSMDEESADLIKSKLSVAEIKRSLAERKAAFLREKIRAQNRAHRKIQAYLKEVFTDDALLSQITDQIKDLRRSSQDRKREKKRLSDELEKLDARVQVEEKYLAAKNVDLSLAGEKDKPRTQELLAVAAERVALLKETQSVTQAELKFTEARLLAIGEFDKLVRLRRGEVFREKLFSKYAAPYSRRELMLVLAAAVFMILLLLFRHRGAALVRRAPASFSCGFMIVYARLYWVLTFMLLAGYGVLNILGYRFASVFWVGVFVSLMAGLTVIRTGKWLAELAALQVQERLPVSFSIDGKKIPVVFFLINTVFTWWLTWVVFSEILKFWAFKKEVVEYLTSAVNHPLFHQGNVTISLWTLGRSGIAFWLFYLISHLIIFFLKNHVLPKTSLDNNSQQAIKAIVRITVIAMGLFVGIQLLGIDLSLLAVFSGTLGIGIGFGLQDIVKNIFSGLVILFERPIKTGDVVELGSVPGTVKSIRTRSTIVNTFDNISMVVPNSEFLTQRVVNWSHSDPLIRVEISVGVDYSSDVLKVKETLLEIAKNNPVVFLHPEPFVIFSEFGDSALLFKLYLWVDVKDRITVKSDINFAICSKFKEKGITIPFPQRDLHLKSMDFDFNA